jgi:cysteine desulfurase
MIYLDHNATSPLLPSAREAMHIALEEAGNPSSVHGAGRRARAVVEKARNDVARLAGANPSAVVFTSGGSEANALALRGAVAGACVDRNPVARILVSAIEHESVRANPAAIAASEDAIRFKTFPVRSDGVVDAEAFRSLLMEGAGRPLVSLMAANNETGVLQPLETIIGIVRKKCEDALIHVDAAQFAGRLPISFAELDVDYMSLSAHKFGGPQGMGALVIRDGVPFVPFSEGVQEMRRRGGTENVAGIAGFGAVAASGEFVAERDRIRALRDSFERKLKGFAQDVVIFGVDAERLPNTSNFAIPGMAAETALIALDLDGIALSSGSACTSGKVSSSHVLGAMGVDPSLARCGLRVSLGPSNTEADIEAALAALKRLVARRAQMNVAAA